MMTSGGNGPHFSELIITTVSTLIIDSESIFIQFTPFCSSRQIHHFVAWLSTGGSTNKVVATHVKYHMHWCHGIIISPIFFRMYMQQKH